MKTQKKEKRRERKRRALMGMSFFSWRTKWLDASTVALARSLARFLSLGFVFRVLLFCFALLCLACTNTFCGNLIKRVNDVVLNLQCSSSTKNGMALTYYFEVKILLINLGFHIKSFHYWSNKRLEGLFSYKLQPTHHHVWLTWCFLF